MVRLAGSYLGFAQTFKAVADHYGWTHIVLVTNDDTSTFCWYGAKSFDKVFTNNDNYTFTWLRVGSRPTDEQLDDILQQIRSLTRGILYVLIIHSQICPPFYVFPIYNVSKQEDGFECRKCLRGLCTVVQVRGALS